MDKTLIRRRFAKAVGSYSIRADVQRQIAYHMADAIGKYIPSGGRRNVLEIGCGTGMFTRAFLHRATPERLLLNDLCPEVEPYLTDLLANKRIHFAASDAEALNFPSGQNLIVSCSAIQWFDQPEKFLAGCRKLLTADGYLAFSTFGPQNVKEVVSLTSDTLPYRSLKELTDVLSAEYQIVYSREEKLKLSFASPLEVLKHLKETGVTGIRRQSWTRGELDDFCRCYREQYTAPDGTVPLTYHPIYMICKK